MGLRVYPGASKTAPAFSEDGDNDNPIRFAVDGRVGGVLERLYYIANENNTSFSDITVTVTPNVANDIVNGDDGYSIKLKDGSTQPTLQEWNNIDEGNEISMDDIENDVTFLPFWVRIEVPRGASVDTITNTYITIEGTETL